MAGILTAFGLIFGLSGPAPAADLGPEFYSVVPDRDWKKALQLSQMRNDPLAKKLSEWLYVTETNISADTREMVAFVQQNPDWPRLRLFRERIEKNIEDALRPHEVAEWFDRHAPRTAKGIQTYMAALGTLGETAKARAALKKFWRTADLDKSETNALYKEYRKILSDDDHNERLDTLLWAQRYREAEHMFPLISKDMKKLAEARIACGRFSSGASSAVNAVPAHLHNDPGLIFDRARWRRNMNLDDGALEMLKNRPHIEKHAGLWWRERHILARRAIEDGDYSRAYQAIINHGLPRSDAANYSEAEWVLGWLALEFLRQPGKAYRHFENFYEVVNSAVSRARAGYWLGRTAEKLGQDTLARNWYNIAAQFPSTFYGQLGQEKLHGHYDPVQFMDDQASPLEKIAFEKKEHVRAIRLLVRAGLPKYADPFFFKLLEDAKDRADYVLVARLARETNNPRFAVEANKQLQQKLGSFLYLEGYPRLSALPATKPESALIHAIMQRESMFNTAAYSPAGARGLMQLMPGTAKQVSGWIGKRYSLSNLTEDPKYNIQLGASYLQNLVEKYDGHYPLAIAAYNAGPGNVNKWLKQFGDPRRKEIDTINWIEKLPIYETRNYVQRVMETYYMYKLRFSEAPRTVSAF